MRRPLFSTVHMHYLFRWYIGRACAWSSKRCWRWKPRPRVKKIGSRRPLWQVFLLAIFDFVINLRDAGIYYQHANDLKRKITATVAVLCVNASRAGISLQSNQSLRWNSPRHGVVFIDLCNRSMNGAVRIMPYNHHQIIIPNHKAVQAHIIARPRNNNLFEEGANVTTAHLMHQCHELIMLMETCVSTSRLAAEIGGKKLGGGQVFPCPRIFGWPNFFHQINGGDIFFGSAVHIRRLRGPRHIIRRTAH